jgi:hypothetical protein
MGRAGCGAGYGLGASRARGWALCALIVRERAAHPCCREEALP